MGCFPTSHSLCILMEIYNICSRKRVCGRFMKINVVLVSIVYMMFLFRSLPSPKKD